jgi:hypothetical protein
MRGLRRFFLYLKFFFEPKDKLVRAEAFAAAKAYYAQRPLRSAKNPYPRVPHYYRRREDFVAFQRGYNNSYRHDYAINKLEQIFNTKS